MRTQGFDITTGPPASPLAGESTAWDDELGDTVDVDVGGDARKGGLIANNVPGTGAGTPCGSHHPCGPDGNPQPAAGGESVDLPLEALPPNTVLGPSRIRKTGVIAVGHAQLGGSSWRHRSSRRIKLP